MMGKKEKKGLIAIIVLSVLFPFLMVRNPLEIPSLVLPLWLSYPGMAGVWFYSGKNLFECFLACYGAGNIGIVCVYFGTSLVQFIFKKILSAKRVSKMKVALSETKVDLPSNKNRKVINWLNRQSLWVILLVFFLPLPWSDTISVIAMRLRGIKSGIWYLFGLNIPHVFLVVFLIYSGMSLFFKVGTD